MTPSTPCECSIMCQDLGEEGGCRYKQPARETLRRLVDITYQHATEDEQVPATHTADLLIDRAFGVGSIPPSTPAPTDAGALADDREKLARAIWDQKPDCGGLGKPWPFDGKAPKEVRTIKHDMPAALELCFLYADTAINIQNAAPLPYDTLEIGAHTASSGCHIYLTDKNGRKIGVIWGKANEKAYTAALIIAAVSALVSSKNPGAQ